MINVIIPAYNCSATLGRALASLVAQTDQRFEVIVVDDCSNEDITPIINDYANKLHILYFRNDHNIGCGMSRQVGIDNATQKFITFLDSDDVFMPYTVETFNSVIEANPNTEYLHSHFYKQALINGDPSLLLVSDGYTWCHGKLYNLDMIKKYNIRNSPSVRWADDSYFNSMCSELLQMSIIRIPTVLWIDNKNSVTRKPDEIRDKEKKKDFINAMIMSAKFVLQHKDSVTHLADTIDKITRTFSLDEEEIEKINQLLKYTWR